jgi:hypothetical protein
VAEAVQAHFVDRLAFLAPDIDLVLERVIIGAALEADPFIFIPALPFGFDMAWVAPVEYWFVSWFVGFHSLLPPALKRQDG